MKNQTKYRTKYRFRYKTFGMVITIEVGFVELFTQWESNVKTLIRSPLHRSCCSEIFLWARYFALLCRCLYLDIFCRPFYTFTPSYIILPTGQTLKCKAARAVSVWMASGKTVSHTQPAGYLVTSRTVPCYWGTTYR